MRAPQGMSAAPASVHSAVLATRGLADFQETGVVLPERRQNRT
jgi:hypothetical protein